MNMKKLLFSLLALMCVLPLWAGQPDSISSYEQRLQRRQTAWDRLLPDMYVVQYAGDFGMISAGVGWAYGREHWETHFLVGYLPPKYGHSHYWTTTLRQLYMPWTLKRGNSSFSCRPLTVSLSLNSIIHGDFWMSEPDRYPHGYYGFSSRMRFHLGLGQRFTFDIPRSRRFLSSSVSFYYELSTCDLYVRQKVLNSSIPLRDILVLGIGAVWKI